jgi:hypothetical protein
LRPFRIVEGNSSFSTLTNMKKTKICIFLLAFFAFLISNVSAQTNKKAEIKRIDAYVKTLDALSKKSKGPHIVFADMSEDYNANQPKWRKFNSEKEFEKAREATELYATAYVWLGKNGRVGVSNFTFSSPSGDWAHFVFHYFREDGSLAKVEAQLNTFYGDITVLRDFYFDRRGRLLRKTTKYLDLETKKPKKPADGDFYDNEVRIYKKTANLPFAALMRKKRKN